MYKPYTIDQYKVYQFLEQNFALEHFLLSPISGSTLMLEDKMGDRIAFAFQNGRVHEVSIPPPSPPEVVKEYLRRFHSLAPKPELNTFDDVTRWWVSHPNPLTYQQALGLPDELYRHFLSHPLLEEEEVRRLAASGLVTEEQYRDIQLWLRNGNMTRHWLGFRRLDGTGELCGLVFNYGSPEAHEFQFYLLDDYYRHMNHI